MVPGVLPPAPTREQVLGVKMTLQGLTVNTKQYGPLRWFGAVLGCLTAEDRQSAYQVMRLAGDTHAIVGFDGYQGPLYNSTDEQPYKHIPAPCFKQRPQDFVDLICEIRREGFQIMCFLGGDDGENGFPIAMQDYPILVEVLKTKGPRDLSKDVVTLPGWDGVFYGYTPAHIAEFGRMARQVLPDGHLGIEHQPGRIPVGNGPADYAAGGMMSTYDMIVHEFDSGEVGNGFPLDKEYSHERTIFHEDHNVWTSPFEDAMGQVWQVGARMLGPGYRRPFDQPVDYDTNAAEGNNHYLAPGTSRGPYVPVAWEWTGLYHWVRGRQTVEIQQQARNYLKACGWKYTG